MASILESIASQAFVITPSNSAPIKDDAANTAKEPFVYLKNNTNAALSLKVKTRGGNEVTIKIGAYFIEPIAVQQVFVTGSDSISVGSLLAYY